MCHIKPENKERDSRRGEAEKFMKRHRGFIYVLNVKLNKCHL